eukprot:Clim_evm3s79 gene=Clim_evmTU3s79
MSTTGRIGALGQHDVGGNDALKEEEDLKKMIEFAATHEFSDWERRTHALMMCIVMKGFSRVSELRRIIETFHPDVYNRVTYYEKWAAAAARMFVEKGVLTQEEINEGMGPLSELSGVATNESPKFKVGDEVMVRQEDFRTRWRVPHVRTPGYIFGCPGVIERYCGEWNDPQAEWFGVEGKMPMYRVRFVMKEVWTPPGIKNERNADDTIDVEIYQNWLVPRAEGEKGVNSVQMKPEDSTEFVTHEHRHDGADHGDHKHEGRADVETTALARETDNDNLLDRPLALLARTILRLCDEKGIITAAEIAEALEPINNAGEKAISKKLVARAWTDPAFKDLLLRDPLEACLKLDLIKSDPEPMTKLTCLENTPDVHNIVVCTLCSCYPLWLLGMPPSWYKSRSYRARAVLEPRRVLRELFGVDIPESKKVRVHDSTSELRYMVLPERPAGTDGWTEEQLESLVTLNCIIGTGLPRDPATITKRPKLDNGS